jgi:hypothetical protein
MLRELDDRWILGLRGSRVDAVTQGTGLTVHLDTGAEIVVNGNALISEGAIGAYDAVSFRIADMTDDQLLRLNGSAILSAVAFKSGSLRVVFSTGQHLNVRSSDRGVTAHVRKPGFYDWSYYYPTAQMAIHASST